MSRSIAAQPAAAFRALEEQLIAHPLDVNLSQAAHRASSRRSRSPATGTVLSPPAVRGQGHRKICGHYPAILRRAGHLNTGHARRRGSRTWPFRAILVEPHRAVLVQRAGPVPAARRSRAGYAAGRGDLGWRWRRGSSVVERTVCSQPSSPEATAARTGEAGVEPPRVADLDPGIGDAVGPPSGRSAVSAANRPAMCLAKDGIGSDDQRVDGRQLAQRRRVEGADSAETEQANSHENPPSAG